ncbi:MAG: hypothetical protein LPK88_12440 [Alphaproteobacteria bacterium]|nr:hypothetical protein [Alphaproteobacteria bacterium]MDX5417107.1 hypothetical protein [Alphaproteobacteria bacterium]MDX5494520.1 hypothetical protein [Alphaproteobacteria bacterium]
MKKLVVLAGLAAALGLAAPAAAQAVSVKPVIGADARSAVELVHGNHYNHNRHHAYKRHNAYRHYYNHPPRVVYRHHKVRPWVHWRPYVVQHHYHGFGAPVYYSSHPHYGPYYHVRAYDRSNVALWLGISAITGAILFSNY